MATADAAERRGSASIRRRMETEMEQSSGRPLKYEPRAMKEFPGVSTWDLGCNFLTRLRARQDHALMVDHESHMALLEALHDEIEPQRNVWQNPFAIAKAEVAFRIVLSAIQLHGMQVAGKTCLDLGCGAVNPLVRLFPLLMLGAKQVQGFELEPVRNPWKAVKFLADVVAAAVVDPSRVFGDLDVERMQLLANLADFDLAKMARGEMSGIPAARATLVQRSIVATGMAPGSADLLMSNSVLEHLPDLDAAMAEWARITPSGGFGMHGIDVIDHRSYANAKIHPLEFLTIESKEPIVFESNRVRLHEFEALFARHGFVVLDQWRGPKLTIPDDLRRRMVEPWRSMPIEHLEYGWSQFLVRKQ
jgi:SAM-dependent methyltransferase